MTKQEILFMRQQKDSFFKSHPQSPLKPEQKASFSGLVYFDYNPNLIFDVEPEPVEGDETIQIMTTTNEIRNYRRAGRFHFTVDDQQVSLTIFETNHGYFLPFVDTGAETYKAGRYLDLEPESDGSFHIDFNQAYNPLCVYNENYSCPLTPFENRLPVEIRAGEKLPVWE